MNRKLFVLCATFLLFLGVLPTMGMTDGEMETLGRATFAVR